LDQLAQEPRDLQIPELEGSLRLLQHGALPLELALRFLSRHAFALEGGSGLLKGGSFLLELNLRMLARAPLLPELLLHRDERGNLPRQVDLQLLSLLGFLLSLALPGPHPLESCAVLLELGSSGSKLCLKLRCRNPHRGQVLARLPQRLVPLQKRRPHLLDRGGVFRSLGAFVQELVPHNL
jgi:hypothetical protein